jgi:hypothetical protein
MHALLFLLLLDPHAQLQTDLEDHAAWCGKNGLREARHVACKTLLLLDPEHKTARKQLKFKWNKKQLRWVQQKNYKRPLDPEGPRSTAGTERMEALTTRFVDAIFAKGKLTARDRTVAMAIAPESERVREANGEIRHGDDWLLIETPQSRKRMKLIGRLRAKLLKDAMPPTEGLVTDEDKQFGIPFPRAWVGSAWRALGDVPDSELKKLLLLCDKTHPMLTGVYGIKATAPRGFSLYVLKGQAETALAKHAAFSDEDRKYSLGIDGIWVPGAFSFVTWSKSPTWRTDVVVRSVFGLHLRHRFGVTAKRGWAFEGFGMWLTYQLAGTRLSMTEKRGTYAKSEKTREAQDRGLDFSKVNWNRLAAKLYDREKRPDLSILIGKELHALTAEDSLVAYALAEYLSTAFPSQTGAFLKAYGHGASMDAALRAHLDMNFPTLEKRFERWLREQ